MLISLMLLSQTKDEVTDAAKDKLRVRAALRGTLSLLEAVLAAEEQVAADAISKVGFWRRETKFVPRSPHYPLVLRGIDDRLVIAV